MDISSITKRQPLNPDDVLYLNGEKCIINAIKGTGTSSIVYEATLDGRKIILKELYPYGLGIFRNKDNSLIIPKNKENDFQSYKDGLNKAYQTQLNFHNDHKVRNFTVEPQKLYKHNNTLYVVMHLANGTSYDLIEPENVLSILEVGKALSKVISYYHEKEFLNLDIKPGNIFVFPETNQLIQLFDFDTVSSKEEILKGEFSYSEGYEAPEVSGSYNGLFSFSDIDERADIYSIGAVIFEKIMGHVPDFSDQRNGKVWDFSHNSYLKDTVPQLQKEIFDLFRKTIARRKENRYSSAKDLISDLENLIKLADIKVFLKNVNIHPLTSHSYFISRNDKLTEIQQHLNRDNVVFIYGIGGIGKSESAKDFAFQSKNKYVTQHLVHYDKSLKNTISHLEFINFDDSFYSYDDLFIMKMKMISDDTRYGNSTLLIIDNYSSTDPEDSFVLEQLKKLHIHIIFTTRETPKDTSLRVFIDKISDEALIEMFFKINPFRKGEKDREKLVSTLIKIVSGHTMTIDLVARQTKSLEQYGEKTLSDVIETLSKSGLNSELNAEVYSNKDADVLGNNQENAVYEHIRALFSFATLNPKQKYILKNACMLPLQGFSTKEFCEFIDLAHFDEESAESLYSEDKEITFLVNNGWLNRVGDQQNKLSIHPVIADIICNELEPDILSDTFVWSDKKYSINEFSFYFCDKLWFSIYQKYKVLVNNYSQLKEYIPLFSSVSEILYFRMKNIKPDYYFSAELKLLYIIGNCYFNLAEYQNAARYYQAILENDGKGAYGYLKLNPLIRLSKIYDKLGDHSNAIKYGLRCIDRNDEYINLLINEAHNLEGSYDTVQNMYYVAGTAFLHSGHYLSALDCFFEALEVYFMRFGEDHGEYALSDETGNITADMGICYEKLGYTRIAAEMYMKTLNYYNQLESWNMHRIALISEFFFQYEDALNAEKSHLKILLERFPENHPDIAYSYYWLGHIYSLLDNYEEALKMLNTAIERYEKYYSSDYHVLGDIYKEKGNIYYAQHDSDACTECFLKALSIFKNNNMSEGKTAALYQKLGIIHQQKKSYKSAMENLTAALEIYQHLEKKERTDLSLMNIYNDITDTLIQMKSYKKARFFALKHLHYYYTSYKNSSRMTLYSFQSTLKTWSYHNKKKHKEHTDDTYNHALEVFNYLAVIDDKLQQNDRTNDKKVWKRLSKIYYYIGKPVKAFRMLLYANNIIRKITDFIDNIRYHHHWEKAMKEEDKKEYETSLSHYRKNLRILKKHPKKYGDLGHTYHGMSRVYEKMENDDLADRYENLEHDIFYGYPHAYELKRDNQWRNL